MFFKLKQNKTNQTMHYKEIFSPNLINNSFLLINSVISNIYSSRSKHLVQTIFIEKKFWAKISLLQATCSSWGSTYIVDGVQFKLLQSSTFQFNFSEIRQDHRLHIYSEINAENFSLLSSTSIFKSTIWLERELSDFSNIYFEGLLDTRRLLLDYFDSKQHWNTHTNNERSYSNSNFEITLNY